MSNRTELEKLGEFGLTESNIQQIVEESGGNSMKTNPINLTNLELESILKMRM